MYLAPRRRGIMVIAYGSRTEDPGIESRQSVGVISFDKLQYCCANLICIVIVCIG
jgi:hypothetical protein